MTKRLVVIDGMSIFYRGFFAMPGLSLPDGTPTGGVFGFASIAVEVIKQLEPDYVAVAWDIRGTSAAKRREVFADYKAGRSKPPEDFYAQLPLLHTLLEHFGWPLYELDQYEADDIMGTFAHNAEAEGIETCIVTGDYDMLQLVSDMTSVYITKKGSELVRYDADALYEKYHVRVDQFVDYKALVGDSSDNIPGVRKIGPKAAEKLLGAYNTLDGIYEHIEELKGAQKQYLIDDKDNAYMSQQLARIFTDAPITIDWHAADIRNTNIQSIRAILQQYEFSSLERRLPEHMQSTDSVDSTTQHATPSLEHLPWLEGGKAQAVLADKVLAYIQDDTLYVAGRDWYSSVDEKDSADIMTHAQLIAFGGGQLCHYALQRAVDVPQQLYDIQQAAFLLNPLLRNTDIQHCIGYDGEEMGQIFARLWQVYDQQQADFAQAPKLRHVAETLDFPLIPLLARMEHEGMLLDTNFLDGMSKELAKEIQIIETAVHAMAGYEFNVSSPQQLQEVLFEKLLLPTRGIKKGKTGYSTGQKELDKLRGLHPIVEQIEKYRELTKLKNTYVDALPKLVDDKQCIHTTFNQDVTATGRLSSTDPNLQNIPIRTELGRKVRQAFIPRPGNTFVGADYSQFELRLAAVMAGDQPLIDDFNSDIDVHTKTASDVYGISPEQVTDDQRRAAKVINFGVLYGMSPHGLAAATDMQFSEAKQFIDTYFELRAPIKQFIEQTIQKAHDDGYVETLFGRRRPTPDIKSSNYMVRSAAERAAANMPIQGTEADLMKKAMLAVEQGLNGRGKQVLQVHDSILIECPKEHANDIATMLKAAMEGVAPELPIRLSVDVKQGDHWDAL